MVILKKIKGKIHSLYDDYKADRFIKNVMAKKKKHDKIRVGFIVQMPEIWDKQIDVYNEMKNNPLFEVFMFVVPNYDITERKLENNYDNNYFINNYKEAIKFFDNEKHIINIDSYELDYVFYQRPYDMYLPAELRSNELVKKIKCCYLPYAFWPFEDKSVGYDIVFFRNIYLSFMDTEENADYLRNILKTKNNKVVCLGYPVFNRYRNGDKSGSACLWAPRWATELKVGSNNFFKYKNNFIELRDEFDELPLILRPHPLAFQNYVVSGLISADDMDKYIQTLKEKNIVLDKNTLIDTTFTNTGILISDISSIMIQFFLTGKPIIYCPTETEICEIYKKMLPGMYVANCWNDIVNYISEIRNGNDYLKETRIQIINELFGDTDDAAKKIKDYIVNDWNTWRGKNESTNT